MWTRALLKTHAKEFFKRNYWRTVLTSFVLTLCIGGGTFVNYRTSFRTSINDIKNAGHSFRTQNILDAALESFGLSDIDRRMLLGVISVVGILLLIGLLIGLALRIFLLQPLEVGCRRFYLDNHNDPASLGSLGFSFENRRYWNIVKTQLLKEVFLFLWGLLFVIPGLIKAYSYRLVPFILADDPDMKPNDAILLSRQLMNGNKWKAFVLDLSFILWNILNVFTFGILGVLWVYPYIHSTNAELYLVLRYGIADPGRSDAAGPQPIEPQPVEPQFEMRRQDYGGFETAQPGPVQPEVKMPAEGTFETVKPEAVDNGNGNVNDSDIYGSRSTGKVDTNRNSNVSDQDIYGNRSDSDY